MKKVSKCEESVSSVSSRKVPDPSVAPTRTAEQRKVFATYRKAVAERHRQVAAAESPAVAAAFEDLEDR